MKLGENWFKYSILTIVLMFYFFFYTKSSISFLFHTISSPIVSFSYRTSENIRGIFLKKKEKKLLINENKLLRELNSKLVIKNCALKNSLIKYTRLKKILNYKDRTDSIYLGTFNIISIYDLFNNSYITVNAGKRDKIKENDFVAYNGYLIGRVRRVNFSTSVIEMIFNEKSLVDGSITIGEKANNITLPGLCRKENNLFTISFLCPQNLKIKKYLLMDTPIYSHGISDNFGKDFIIGFVGREIKKEVNKYIYEIRTIPNIRQLKELNIYRKLK